MNIRSIYGALTSRFMSSVIFTRGIRSPFLFLSGYKITNPYFHEWENLPKHNTEVAIRNILRRVKVKRFHTVVDHGCGNARNYIPGILKKFSDVVIGVDILKKTLVSPVLDKYVKVNYGYQEDSYFDDAIKPNSVDCVFSLSYRGMSPADDWVSYVSEYYVARYLRANSYLSLVKPGGYLIIQEWESCPEKRFGRAGLKYVQENISKYYKSKNIPGFEVVLMGYSKEYGGGYVVFKKTTYSTIGK